MNQQHENETAFEAYRKSLDLQIDQHHLLLMAWAERDELRGEVVSLRAALDREQLLYINAANERKILQSKLDLMEQLQAHRNRLLPAVPDGWTAEEIMAREG